MVNTLIALMLYPGVLSTLLLSALIAFLARIPLPMPRLLGTIRQSRYGLLTILSMMLTIGASLLTPWPFHPLAGPPVGNLLLAWVAIEAAALVPLLPGLASTLPLAVRAASREAQIGLAGRSVVWLAIVVAGYAGHTTIDLPGTLLAFLGGLLALLAAAGMGPFGPERSLDPDPSALGLDDVGMALLPFARLVRLVVLLGLLTSVIHPLRLFSSVGTLILTLLCMVGCGLGLRWAASIPRLTLPAGLAWCWWKAFPLALAGLVYLIVT